MYRMHVWCVRRRALDLRPPFALAGAEEAPYECPECEVVSSDADNGGGDVRLGGEGGSWGGGEGMSEVAAMMVECRRELQAEAHRPVQGDTAAAAACQHALGEALPLPPASSGSTPAQQEQVLRTVP